MNEEKSPSAVVSEANSSEASHSSTEEAVQRHWQGVVKRRSFLKGLGIASATLSAGALLGTGASAKTPRRTANLPKGTEPRLRSAAAQDPIEPNFCHHSTDREGVQ